MALIVDGIKFVSLLAKAGQSFATGSWEKGLAQSAAAAGAGAVSLGKNYITKKSANEIWKKQVPILDGATVVSSILELLVGPGKSEKGEDIELSAKDFELAFKSLELAMADANYWSGAAAQAYNDRNSEQMHRTTRVAKIDRQMAAIVEHQGHQAHTVSVALTICGASLVAAVPIAIGLKFIPEVGEAVSLAFQIATVIAVMAAEVIEIYNLIQDASTNGGQFADLKSQYQMLADGAYLEGTTNVKVSVDTEESTTIDAVDGLTSSAVPPALGSRGVGEGTGEGSLFDAAAESDREAGGFAAISGGADDWTAADAQVNSGAEVGSAGEETGAEPEEDRSGHTPSIFGGMPSAGQIANWAADGSKQAAQYSKYAGRHVGRFNQTMSTAQQLGSMFPSGQGGTGSPSLTGQFEQGGPGADDTGRAPVDGTGPGPADQTILTSDVDGAAAGGDDSERAPIHDAEGTVEQAGESDQRASSL